MRALVVEDDSDLRALICFFLRKADVQVDSACDGKEGLFKALNHSFDVIFLDIEIPVFSGFQVASILRQSGVEIPIVALTGHQSVGLKDKCLEEGFNDYLMKPVTFDSIETILKHFSPSVRALPR